MRHLLIALALFGLGCSSPPQKEAKSVAVDSTYIHLAADVKQETLRSWKAYKQYAWGHDALMPLSRAHEDWYAHPLYISPIDAYGS